MKVCFISHTSRLDGAERSLIETVRALTNRGIECEVLLPSRGPLCKLLAGIPVRYGVFPYKWWSATEGGKSWKRWARTAWNLGLVIPVALRIRSCRADLVYTNTVVVCVGAWAAAVAGCKHVWHLRELGHLHNRMVFDLGERYSLGLVRRLSALVLANSHCVAERYRDALHPKQAEVVYQGVQVPDDVDPYYPAKGNGFRCVVVGSIGFSKRQEEAIRAAAMLGERGRRVELVLVGEGDPRYTKILHDLVDELDLQDRVRFLGQLESAYPVIAGADAVVHCSRHEAFGRVTVEGMLAGKPVIGARSAGTAELIRDGENGMLYEPGNVEQLSDLIERLIDAPDEAHRLGDTARTRARARFTPDRFADDLLGHLQTL